MTEVNKRVVQQRDGGGWEVHNRQRRPLPDEFREAHAAYKASRRCAS